MPEYQMATLQQAGSVHFKLPRTYRIDREERHFIERRFTGRLVSWKALPHDSRHVIAEFTCEPPAQAIREMTSGRQVVAQLLWIPPLFSIPAVKVGACMAVLGLIALVVLRFFGLRTAAELSVRSLDTQVNASSSGLAGEAATLRALGIELRELILRQELDTSTIATAERAMDRDKARAERLLSAGLGLDSSGCPESAGGAREEITPGGR